MLDAAVARLDTSRERLVRLEAKMVERMGTDREAEASKDQFTVALCLVNPAAARDAELAAVRAYAATMMPPPVSWWS